MPARWPCMARARALRMARLIRYPVAGPSPAPSPSTSPPGADGSVSERSRGVFRNITRSTIRETNTSDLTVWERTTSTASAVTPSVLSRMMPAEVDLLHRDADDRPEVHLADDRLRGRCSRRSRPSGCARRGPRSRGGPARHPNTCRIVRRRTASASAWFRPLLDPRVRVPAHEPRLESTGRALDDRQAGTLPGPRSNRRRPSPRPPAPRGARLPWRDRGRRPPTTRGRGREPRHSGTGRRPRRTRRARRDPSRPRPTRVVRTNGRERPFDVERRARNRNQLSVHARSVGDAAAKRSGSQRSCLRGGPGDPLLRSPPRGEAFDHGEVERRDTEQDDGPGDDHGGVEQRDQTDQRAAPARARCAGAGPGGAVRGGGAG